VPKIIVPKLLHKNLKGIVSQYFNVFRNRSHVDNQTKTKFKNQTSARVATSDLSNVTKKYLKIP
jgi:hypothetical protein